MCDCVRVHVCVCVCVSSFFEVLSSTVVCVCVCVCVCAGTMGGMPDTKWRTTPRQQSSMLTMLPVVTREPISRSTVVCK